MLGLFLLNTCGMDDPLAVDSAWDMGLMRLAEIAFDALCFQPKDSIDDMTYSIIEELARLDPVTQMYYLHMAALKRKAQGLLGGHRQDAKPEEGPDPLNEATRRIETWLDGVHQATMGSSCGFTEN